MICCKYILQILNYFNGLLSSALNLINEFTRYQFIKIYTNCLYISIQNYMLLNILNIIISIITKYIGYINTPTI